MLGPARGVKDVPEVRNGLSPIFFTTISAIASNAERGKLWPLSGAADGSFEEPGASSLGGDNVSPRSHSPTTYFNEQHSD